MKSREILPASQNEGTIAEELLPDAIDETSKAPNNESISTIAPHRSKTCKNSAMKTSGESASRSFSLDLPGKSTEPVVFPLLKPAAMEIGKAKLDSMKPEKTESEAAQSRNGIQKRLAAIKLPAIEDIAGGTIRPRNVKLKNLIGFMNKQSDEVEEIPPKNPLQKIRTLKHRQKIHPNEDRSSNGGNLSSSISEGSIDKAMTQSTSEKRIASQKKGRLPGSSAAIWPKDESVPDSRGRVIVIAPRRKVKKPVPAFWERNYFNFFRFISFR